MSYATWLEEHPLREGITPAMIVEALNNMVDEDAMRGSVPRSGFNEFNPPAIGVDLLSSMGKNRLGGLLFQEAARLNLGPDAVTGIQDRLLGLSSFGTFYTNDVRKIEYSTDGHVDTMLSVECKDASTFTLENGRGKIVGSSMKDIAGAALTFADDAKKSGWQKSDGTDKELSFMLDLPISRINGYLSGDAKETQALNCILNILECPVDCLANPDEYLDSTAANRLIYATWGKDSRGNDMQIGYWCPTSWIKGTPERIVVKYGFEPGVDDLHPIIHVAVGKIAVDPTTGDYSGSTPQWIAGEPSIDTFPGGAQAQFSSVYGIEALSPESGAAFMAAAAQFQRFLGGTNFDVKRSQVERDLAWFKYDYQRADDFFAAYMEQAGAMTPGTFERAFETECEGIGNSYASWRRSTSLDLEEQLLEAKYVPRGLSYSKAPNDKNKILFLMTEGTLAARGLPHLETVGDDVVTAIKDQSQGFLELAENFYGLDMFFLGAKGMTAFDGATPGPARFLYATGAYHPKGGSVLDDMDTIFARYVKPMIDDDKVMMVQGGVLAPCRDLSTIFPATTDANTFYEGGFDISFRGYYRIASTGEQYLSSSRSQPILNENMIELLVERAIKTLQQSMKPFELDEATVRLANDKITAFRAELERIVALPLEEQIAEGWAQTWYPFHAGDGKITVPSDGTTLPSHTDTYLYDVGEDPARPGYSLEVTTNPSKMGLYVLSLYQDIFATMLDGVAEQNGPIGDYRTAMLAVHDMLETRGAATKAEVSNMKGTTEYYARKLGLSLLLAKYDAVSAERGQTSLIMLYDAIARTKLGGWSLVDDVQNFVQDGNHMEILNERVYGNFIYYEIKIKNPSTDLGLPEALDKCRLIMRVPINENQLRIHGAYVFVDCVVNDGVPTSVVGPTLTWAQFEYHANAMNLESWLASRELQHSNLFPQRMRLPWVAIAQATDPSKLVDGAGG